MRCICPVGFWFLGHFGILDVHSGIFGFLLPWKTPKSLHPWKFFLDASNALSRGTVVPNQCSLPSQKVNYFDTFSVIKCCRTILPGHVAFTCCGLKGRANSIYTMHVLYSTKVTHCDSKTLYLFIQSITCNDHPVLKSFIYRQSPIFSLVTKKLFC